METLIAWVGFAGGWLLVAGPVLQAALELSEEDEARASLQRAMTHVPMPPPISPWWWLFPPARFVIQKRRSDQVQRALADQLEPGELEVLVRYFDKARGWILVGAGATLIATKETWELTEHHEWPLWVFWLLVVVMLAVGLGNAGATLALSRRVVEVRAGRRA